MKRFFPIAVLFLLTASAEQAAWTTMKIKTASTDIYPTWHQWGYGSETIDDVLYITERVNGTVYSPYENDNCAGGGVGNRRGFRSQTFANPHVQFADNGDWLIQGYGDVFTETTPDVCNNNYTAPFYQWIADAVYTIKRRADNGQYEIPARTLPDSPSMKFQEGTSDLGYLGSGAGIAKTTQAVSCSGCTAYKFFSIMPVGIPATGTGWVTWAMSTDGLSWVFLNSAGTGTTTDARSSYHLIHTTSDKNDESSWHYWHIAMAYNAPDATFYVNLGYNTNGGIKGTWWRFKYDSSSFSGLNLASSSFRQILQRGTPSCGTPGAIESTTNDVWQNHGGVLSNPGSNGGWIFEAQSPRTGSIDTGCATPKTAIGPADPMDIVILKKADGSVDSLLYVYASENAMFSGAPGYYVKGSLPTGATSSADFQWSTPQPFDYSPIDSSKYGNCSSGGGYYFCVVQSGNDASGNPVLFAFIVTSRKDKYAPGDCGSQWSGLLPVKLTLE